MPKKYRPVKRPESEEPERNKLTYKERLTRALKSGKINKESLSDISKYAINNIMRREEKKEEN